MLRLRTLPLQQRLLALAAVAFVTLGVPAAVVVAQSGNGHSESGTPGEVSHASPQRTSPLLTVAHGETAQGQTYAIQISRAGELVCVAIDYGPRPANQPQLAARPLGSEQCLDPAARQLAASLEQTFPLDLETGEMRGEIERFAFGVAPGAAESVQLSSPGGRTIELRPTDVPGFGFKVFAGSAPVHATEGMGEVIALDSRGAAIARQGLRFAGRHRVPSSKVSPPGSPLPDAPAHAP
jgi:hypothetical protein